MKIIRGGWVNVPDNWKCKTDLKKLGLVPRPNQPVVGRVWNKHQWVDLFIVNNCRKKRVLTEKQRAALERGRTKLREKLTCSACGEIMTSLKHMIGNICEDCHDIKEYKAYINEQRKACAERFLSLYEKDFLILDTETTGLSFGDEIIELAILDKSKKVIYNSLFNPKFEIPDEAVAIHGITNQMVKDAPSWLKEWETIKKLLADKTVCIYNADFDNMMIKSTCELWNVDHAISYDSFCVMNGYADFIDSEFWVSLEDASGINTSHRAADDCKATLSVIQSIMKEIQI